MQKDSSKRSVLAGFFLVSLVIAMLLAFSAFKIGGRVIQGALLLIVVVAIVSSSSKFVGALDTVRKTAGL